eukprot:GEMP01098323.1.p2 GENE.GEMP01098323.1~~GEMP01098323.1.p2  ORF type:complete len:135 (+),score=29.77 GEMP01098323.1:39-407(+)
MYGPSTVSMGAASHTHVEEMQKALSYHRPLLERRDDRIQRLECERTYAALTHHEGMMSTEFVEWRGEEKERGALHSFTQMILWLAPPEYSEQCAGTVETGAKKRRGKTKVWVSMSDGRPMMS